MILKLKTKLEEYLKDKEEESMEEQVEDEDNEGELDLNDIYVRQIDYT